MSFLPQKIKKCSQGSFAPVSFAKKKQLFKSKMWCVFLKINQKVVEACVVVLLSQATLIFLDSLNLSRLSSSQEILKVRVDLFHALYLVVLDCKEIHQTDLSSSISCHQSHNITWKSSSFNSKAFVFNFWVPDIDIQEDRWYSISCQISKLESYFIQEMVKYQGFA